MCKLSSYCLPVRSRLLHRNWKLESPLCPHGCGSLEDEGHLFFKCTVARALWLAYPWSIKWEYLQLPSLEAYLDRIVDLVGSLPIFHSDGDSFVLYAVIILESIWKIRNKLICEGKRNPLEDQVRVINKRFAQFWTSRPFTTNQLAPTRNQATA